MPLWPKRFLGHPLRAALALVTLHSSSWLRQLVLDALALKNFNKRQSDDLEIECE
jgi:hypothetical protein